MKKRSNRKQEKIISPYKLVRRKGIVKMEKRSMVDKEFYKHTKLVGDTVLMLPDQIYINSLRKHTETLKVM